MTITDPARAKRRRRGPLPLLTLTLCAWLSAASFADESPPALPPLPAPERVAFATSEVPFPVDTAPVPTVPWPGAFDASPPTPGNVPVAPPPEPQGYLLRPQRFRIWANQPSPVLADPLAGVLEVEIVSRPSPGCDPILYGFWLEELRAAVNASPRFRVGPGATATLRPWDAPLPPVVAVGPDGAARPEGMNLRLDMYVRSIQPYRPMRVDAELVLLDVTTGAPVARLDGVWEAPLDGVPLRQTRHGWFRRVWHPSPALSEAAALEANSPRMFLRGTAQRMAEALVREVDAAACATE